MSWPVDKTVLSIVSFGKGGWSKHTATVTVVKAFTSPAVTHFAGGRFDFNGRHFE